jgi:peptidoglycan hydrolase-like protein with peptidoglycan-binding domain
VIIDPGYVYDPGYAYVETTPSTAVVTGDLVRDVQLELARAGYDPGPLDGILGQATRDAIAQFQADRGLGVSGRIDNALLENLGLN